MNTRIAESVDLVYQRTGASSKLLGKAYDMAGDVSQEGTSQVTAYQYETTNT